MQDLLQEFDSPSVMDCKMGVRWVLYGGYRFLMCEFVSLFTAKRLVKIVTTQRSG